ncbi:IS4 family transposase [bacterium]|nr:IS4 family transposase [bacterium]
MVYHKTIFRQMLQLFSRLEFQNIVDYYKGDHRVRTLKCWDQFIHIIFGQFSKRDSLRDTLDTMNSQQRKFYHLGTTELCRSTLSDANNKRNYRIYQDLFFKILMRVQNIAPKYKLKLNRKFYILDSTTIDLCLKLFPWARFRKTKAAVKLHTLMQADGALPVFLRITDGKVHDTKIAREVPVPNGSYLAIDRAYHDFQQYKCYNDNNIRFVTRKKTNARYVITKTNQVDGSTGIIADETIEFTGYYTHKKYPYNLRIIRYWDSETEKELEFLTNDFEMDAFTITQIYKARWEIELFFKTIKQNLKIKRFIGNSANAVWIQIWIAMIAYLLVSYLKFVHKSKYSIQKLFHRIQINLFERKPLNEIILNQKFIPPNNAFEVQFSLFGTLTGH